MSLYLNKHNHLDFIKSLDICKYISKYFLYKSSVVVICLNIDIFIFLSIFIIINSKQSSLNIKYTQILKKRRHKPSFLNIYQNLLYYLDFFAIYSTAFNAAVKP